METKGLILAENISSRAINSKRNLYEIRTIKKGLREKFENDGWEYVPSKLKKSIRVKKAKKHNVAFEERVWALFAKMGFDYINTLSEFHLDYGTGLRKQIDVFAFDSEAILIVECKSTPTRQRKDYREAIGEFANLKNDLRISAQNIAKKKQKVAYLFCTNNARVSKPDKTRLSDNSIIHLNQDALEYYEQLSDHLGAAAKYQLYANLFSEQSIPGLNNKVPAIRGKVPGGHTIYSFCIDPQYLLKIGYVLHRNDANAEASQAYQRLVKKSRLNQVAKFIENGGYFPNSIIINIETKKKKRLNFDLASSIDHDGSTDFGILHLPKTYRSAFIIDGQHRLYGYSLEKSGSNHTIPVVAFHNLPEDEQAQIFIDINRNQRSVPANLLQSIMAEFHWGSENPKLALSALRTKLLVELATDDDSPLYDRIILAEEKKNLTRCLTINSLKSWGLNRVEFLGVLRGNSTIKKGYLEGNSPKDTLNRSKEFLNHCFNHFESECSDQWDTGSGEGGFIAMNIGISATFRIIDDILNHLASTKRIDLYGKPPESLYSLVKEYLVPISIFLNDLDFEGISKLRGFFGSGATEKVQKEFQYAIYQDNPNFCPEGLLDWIRSSTGEFNDRAQELGFKIIEPSIDNYIKTKLKETFGTDWWSRGVPKKIQKNCSNKKIDVGSLEPEHSFLNLLDYEGIIRQNWSIFGETFTPPGFEEAGKEKRLSWFNMFNSIRQKYSHPQRENVSEDELNFLEDLYNWLSPRIQKS